METKKGLKPWMKVRNLTTDNIGELMPYSDEEPNRLAFCADSYVYIRTRLPSGKWSYRHWALKNIELVSE